MRMAEGGENRRLLLFEAVFVSKGLLDIGTVAIIPLFPSQGYPESAAACAEPARRLLAHQETLNTRSTRRQPLVIVFASYRAPSPPLASLAHPRRWFKELHITLRPAVVDGPPQRAVGMAVAECRRQPILSHVIETLQHAKAT